MVKLSQQGFQARPINQSSFRITRTNIVGSVKELKKSQCQSVRSVQTCLQLSIFIFLSQVSLRSVSGQSQVSLRSVSGQSQVSLCAYFVRQTEPEILRLVLVNVGHICSLFSSRVTTLAFLGQLPCLSFPLACSCVHTPDICLPKKFSQLFLYSFNILCTYRVIFDNLNQELTCYRLVLSLLRFSKASM